MLRYTYVVLTIVFPLTVSGRNCIISSMTGGWLPKPPAPPSGVCGTIVLFIVVYLVKITLFSSKNDNILKIRIILI